MLEFIGPVLSASANQNSNARQLYGQKSDPLGNIPITSSTGKKWIAGSKEGIRFLLGVKLC